MTTKQPKASTDLQGAILDIALEDLLRCADNGDEQGARALHRTLAEAIRGGYLTPYASDLLAGMHESIAQGRKADVAMLTQKLSHRGTKQLRDRQIFNRIDSVVKMHEHVHKNRETLMKRFPDLVEEWDRPLKLTGRGGLFEKVGKEFGLSAKTIANKYHGFDVDE